MQILEQLNQEHVDVAGALKRFCGNESLYLKFINAFPADQNFKDLGNSLAGERYEEAVIHAHTLKGLTANLGMDQLSGICDSMVKKFRSGDTDGVDELYSQLSVLYEKIIAALKG